MVKNFGQLSSGETAHLYSLMTDMLRICVTDFGGTLVSVEVKDKSGEFVDITLGYDDVAGYENDNDCFGFNIGRNANRISNAQFTLNNIKYVLAKNDGENNLHSGPHLFSKRMWHVTEYRDDSIIFEIESLHLDQGFPGNAKFYIIYRITDSNSFEIEYNGYSN